jgi:hypothetical protein
MIKKRRCPECNQWLDIDMVDCDCGWKGVKSPMPAIADHRCNYQQSGLRCPYPGRIHPARMLLLPGIAQVITRI